MQYIRPEADGQLTFAESTDFFDDSVLPVWLP